MTWTFDPTQLSAASSVTASLAKVRVMIGDTDTTWQLLSDEIIYFTLTNQSSPTLAAATACDFVAASFLRQCNTENSALRVSAAARHKHYLEMADRLRKGGPGEVPQDGGLVLADMYVGGAEHAAVDALKDNDSRVQPLFSVGEHDIPDTSFRSHSVTLDDD
jgi:hypothetical protein